MITVLSQWPTYRDNLFICQEISGKGNCITHIAVITLLDFFKEDILLSNNRDEHRKHYAKLSKLNMGRKMVHYLVFMWILIKKIEDENIVSDKALT